MKTTPEKWLERQRKCWNFAAPGCSELESWLDHHYEPVTEAMLRMLPPVHGRLLDVACGTGSLTRLLADQAEEVIGIDIAPEMILAAEERSGSYPNTRFRVQSADESIEDIGPFDGIYSRFGLMFAADCSTALENLALGSTPGSGICIAVWGTESENPWSEVVSRVLLEHHNLSPPAPTDPSAFRMADPEDVRSMFLAAGWRPEAQERVLVPGWDADGPELMWERLRKTAGPIGLLFERTPEEERAALRGRIIAAIAEVPTGGMTGLAWVHTGIRHQ